MPWLRAGGPANTQALSGDAGITQNQVEGILPAKDMGVSLNGGTPNWMVCNGKPY